MDFLLHHRTDRRHARQQFLFVVGRVAPPFAHDEHRFVHRRLRVIRLLEMGAAARFHDPAFRISEVILRPRLGLRTRRLGLGAARFFPGHSLGLTPKGRLFALSRNILHMRYLFLLLFYLCLICYLFNFIF